MWLQTVSADYPASEADREDAEDQCPARRLHVLGPGSVIDSVHDWMSHAVPVAAWISPSTALMRRFLRINIGEWSPGLLGDRKDIDLHEVISGRHILYYGDSYRRCQFIFSLNQAMSQTMFVA
jgi:hypothetical protein